MNNEIGSMLENDHEALSKLLEDLEKKLAAFDPTLAYKALDLFWARLAMHIRAENVRLFPALLKLPKESLTGKGGRPTPAELHEVLELLRTDHDFFMTELTHMIKMLRKSEVQREEIGDVAERLGGLKQRLEKHNQLEEELAYVWPSTVFDAPTMEKLATRVRRELTNLPPRFVE